MKQPTLIDSLVGACLQAISPRPISVIARQQAPTAGNQTVVPSFGEKPIPSIWFRPQMNLPRLILIVSALFPVVSWQSAFGAESTGAAAPAPRPEFSLLPKSFQTKPWLDFNVSPPTLSVATR
jgi:hypothetical protein